MREGRRDLIVCESTTNPSWITSCPLIFANPQSIFSGKLFVLFLASRGNHKATGKTGSRIKSRLDAGRGWLASEPDHNDVQPPDVGCWGIHGVARFTSTAFYQEGYSGQDVERSLRPLAPRRSTAAALWYLTTTPSIAPWRCRAQAVHCRCTCTDYLGASIGSYPISTGPPSARSTFRMQ